MSDSENKNKKKSELAQTQVHEREGRRTHRDRGHLDRTPHRTPSLVASHPPPLPRRLDLRSSAPPLHLTAEPTPHSPKGFSSLSPFQSAPDAVPPRRDRVTGRTNRLRHGSPGLRRRPGGGAAAGVAVRAGLRRARGRRGRAGRCVHDLEIRSICGGLSGWVAPAGCSGPMRIGRDG
jgi:hypothetical protein